MAFMLIQLIHTRPLYQQSKGHLIFFLTMVWRLKNDFSKIRLITAHGGILTFSGRQLAPLGLKGLMKYLIIGINIIV